MVAACARARVGANKLKEAATKIATTTPAMGRKTFMATRLFRKRVERCALGVLLRREALHRSRLGLFILVHDRLMLGILLLFGRRHLQKVRVLARHHVKIVRRDLRGSLRSWRERHLGLQLL